MIIKIINALLMLFAAAMGLKQGYAMMAAKPDMLILFGKWGFGKTAILVNGLFTFTAALLLLFPKTFIWGNFIMAAGILLIICFHLQDRDMKGVAIELPFLLLNLVILYLQHPLNSGK